MGLKYIFTRSKFHNAPISTLFKIAKWELKKIFHLNSLVYLDDFKMKLYPQKRRGIDGLIYIFGENEKEKRLFDKIVKPGFIVFDIGANIGSTSLRFASLVGEHGKVYCFEPITKTYNRLVENILINDFKNIILYKYALSDSNYEREMFYSYVSDRNSFAPDQINYGSEKVECIMLDTFITKNNIGNINFIKIDVEGAELFVLKGGINALLKNSPIIYLEIFNKKIKELGYTLEDLQNFTRSIGYNFFRIKHDLSKAIKIEDITSVELENVLLVKTTSDFIEI